MKNEEMNKIRNSSLGEKIKDFRNKEKITQDSLAEKLNTTRSTISKWESDSSEPSASQAKELSDIFKISVEVLLDDSIDSSTQTKIRRESIVVVDTSILLNTPVIIKDLIDNFDKVLIPDVVCQELDNIRSGEKTKGANKQKAWLAMETLEKHRASPKLIIRPVGYINTTDKFEKVVSIAISEAKSSLVNKVYMFSKNNIFALFVGNLSNLEYLSPKKYDEIFFSSKNNCDPYQTQEFFKNVKNKKNDEIDDVNQDEVDVNRVDSATGHTPLIAAIRNRDITMIEKLIKNFDSLDLNAKDNQKYKFTPLLHACQLKSLELIKILVEAGADVNFSSSGENRGNMPLMVCAWGGFKEGVLYLMEQDVSFNQQDNNGYTALHKACIKGDFDIAELLVYKTDTKIRDRDNKTAEIILIMKAKKIKNSMIYLRRQIISIKDEKNDR